MMSHDYQYEENSRRPITVFAFMLSCAFLGIGISYSAPWYFLAPVLVSSAMALWMILANRVSGMQLVGSELLLYSGKWTQSITVSQIDAVRIKYWSESAPSVSLKLNDGSNVAIPGYCIGSAEEFAIAVSNRDISVYKC